MSRCIGFDAILYEYASYDLAEHLISALYSISFFEEGYYHYYFTTFNGEQIVKSNVRFARQASCYRFIINGKHGFTITPKNVYKNFGKLIDNIPTLVLYQYARTVFDDTLIPVNVFDFIKAIHNYSGGNMYYGYGQMNILYDYDDQDFNIRIRSERDVENIYFYLDKNGYCMFFSSLDSGGSCRVLDNYVMATFQTMLSVNEFLERSGFLDEDLYHLAPNGFKD